MSHLWTDLLNGGEDSWAKFVSETTIDDIINIFEINHKKANLDPHINLKEKLWFELACIAYVWGAPSSTKLKTSPTQMKVYTKQVKSNVLGTLKFLENVHGLPLSETWIETQDILLAKAIYGHFDDAYDEIAFRDDFQEIIEKLKKVLGGIEAFEKTLPNNSQKQGVSKPSKDKHDILIRQLCAVYKRYTGQEPIAWNTGTSALNDKQIIGDIILFLQAVLSNTFYSGDIGAEALQKKIYRMMKTGKYPEIWLSNKN